MGHLFLLLIFFVNGLYAIFYPWIGITAGYLFSILGPQYLWWWHFQGIRSFYLIAIPTVIGFLFNLLKGSIDSDIAKNKIVLFVFFYFLFLIASYFWGPYIDVYNEWRFFNAHQVLITMLKIFIFFIMALFCISDIKKLRFFYMVLPLVVLYLTYWANMKYLSGNFFLRLKGPTDEFGNGIYSDENNFAMVFVCGIPFLFYLGWYFKRWYLRYTTWIAIPFVWHAIFLTASRGGLLGAAFVSLLSAIKSPKRALGVLLIPAFLFAYSWQGGSILKARAKTIEKYGQESSAMSRIQAWKAGVKMILRHPLTGVGVASFGQAYPYFADSKPRVAHNTFIQIAAESGIFAGIFYVLVIFYALTILIKSKRYCTPDSFISCVADSTFVALCGFVVCASFLTLTGFEIQFYLIILANSVGYLAFKEAHETK